MTEDEANELGKVRGKEVAYQREESTWEEFLEACSEAESNSRQYTDFSFIAHDFNSAEHPEELWDAYESGLECAFEDYWDSLDGVLQSGDYRT